ncbi:DUF1405 domain-containing protein [Moorella sulfitireducens]|uniref:DUF1405 domain-containing protein n=1 Tax=Neomoorella sulfitireducens TaxID=2972948 RepID=UPI0021AD45EE|nr:DUF1405 domain-containing protein [Moorella sulfitireducens]
MLHFFRWLKHLLWEAPYQNLFLVTLAAVNLLGSLYGYYWYREQLAETPLIWWPVTPDSPLATTLFGLAMILAYCRRESGFLRAVAAAAVIKYGLWAVIIISDYWLSGAPVTVVETGLWLSHLGMTVEGFLFLRHWPVSISQFVLVVLWLGVNDFVDYRLGLHPYLFSPGQENLALVTAVVLSLALSLWYLFRAINWPRRQEK